ncbi:unnamed protein product [Fraxinus pennsylvanica]|uniref:phosphoglycerate kinase n=1 Tax=Fraxinus pennsylvanica TaxID=56036 RepID=A0AAD2AF90_9LAMI|nr:unnamed protein product [Fraxinus pennsylvanica]
MDFAKKSLNDALGIAHEAVEGVSKFLPPFTGSHEKRELDIGPIQRPFVAVVDGKRVSNRKLQIESMLDKSDTLILNGEMIFTFYKAQDLSVGSFPVDDEDVNFAKSILEKAKLRRVEILLPSDVVVVDRFTYYGKNKVVAASAIPDGWTGVDIGPESVYLFHNALDSAKTVMWEGAETYEFGKFSRALETISPKVFELGDKGVKTFIGVQTETGSSEIEYTRTVGAE